MIKKINSECSGSNFLPTRLVNRVATKDRRTAIEVNINHSGKKNPINKSHSGRELAFGSIAPKKLQTTTKKRKVTHKNVIMAYQLPAQTTSNFKMQKPIFNVYNLGGPPISSLTVSGGQVIQTSSFRETVQAANFDISPVKRTKGKKYQPSFSNSVAK